MLSNSIILNILFLETHIQRENPQASKNHKYLMDWK